MQLPGLYGYCIFRFLRETAKHFQSTCTALHSHQQYAEFPLSSQDLVVSSTVALLVGVWRYLVVDFISISITCIFFMCLFHFVKSVHVFSSIFQLDSLVLLLLSFENY